MDADSPDRPNKRQRTLQQQNAAQATAIAAQHTSPPHHDAFAPPPPPIAHAHAHAHDHAAAAHDPPPPPPLPINDSIVPPPPDNDAFPPPPPSPPPPAPDDAAAHPDGSRILPPPPPPPPDTHDDQEGPDDEAVGGAEYWARLAAEEEEKRRADNVNDLYLDTINRSLLDFDFEKLCSVSLSNINVYACLVCGKYFQGRGKSSYAYFHSIDEGHRVYMNLSSAEVYVLPDNYKVTSPSLSDIQFLLNPTFTPQQVAQLDAPDARPALDLEAKPYLPGFVGLNNISENDYMNVVIQALAHIKPLRDFFIRGGPRLPGQSHLRGNALTSGPVSVSDASGSLASSTELVRRFGALVRKIWNPRAFKGQVSPHEFLQEVANASDGRFKLTQQSDPIEFLGWLLNRLHMDLTGGKRRRESIISRCFQGEVRIESQKVIVRTGIEEELLMGTEELGRDGIDKLDHDGRKEGGQEDEHGNAKFNIDKEVQTNLSPFLLLAIDLPAPPVFQDAVEKNIIPQVTIASVLAKYNGVSFQEANAMIRRFKITKLPPFIILHFRRFTKNRFVEERNPTIVNFPIKQLDLSEYVEGGEQGMGKYYDLVCNVTHEATAGTVRDNGVWRAQVHTRTDGVPIHPETKTQGEEKWFQIQDLIVEELNKQMIFLGETYIQIWERKGASAQVEAAMTKAALVTPPATSKKAPASSLTKLSESK
ncbi:Ubiquitin carboxyl-terminal hydrolase 10 [Thecaphora frezii]